MPHSPRVILPTHPPPPTPTLPHTHGQALTVMGDMPILMDVAYPELTSWAGEEVQTRQARRAARAAPPPLHHGASGDEALDFGEVARELGLEGYGGGGGGAGAAEVGINWGATAFYEQAGTVAAALGVCVHLYAASPHFLGLEVIHPLVASSGGTLSLYPSLDDAALPQVGSVCVRARTRARACVCVCMPVCF
jgi:hypothetical protein